MRPFTHAVRPFTHAVRPFTHAVRPFTHAVRPFTHAVRPFTHAVRPFTHAVRPFTHAVRPFTQAVRPFTHAVIHTDTTYPSRPPASQFARQAGRQVSSPLQLRPSPPACLLACARSIVAACTWTQPPSQRPRMSCYCWKACSGRRRCWGGWHTRLCPRKPSHGGSSPHKPSHGDTSSVPPGVQHTACGMHVSCSAAWLACGGFARLCYNLLVGSCLYTMKGHPGMESTSNA